MSIELFSYDESIFPKSMIDTSNADDLGVTHQTDGSNIYHCVLNTYTTKDDSLFVGLMWMTPIHLIRLRKVVSLL